MFTYQKVRLGLIVLAFALPLLTAAFGVYLKPLDEIGGGGQL
jgi:hypothetical protein